MSICIEKQLVTDFYACPQLAGKRSKQLGLWGLPARWIEWRRRRRIHRLLDLDARLIDDMGLTDEEIRAALLLPLSENASDWMHRRAALRRSEDFAALRRRKPVTGLLQW